MSEEKRTLFVGNLCERVNEGILHELFLQAGPVERVKIPQTNGKSRSYAFITFKHECSVPYSIALLHNTSLYGRTIKLSPKSGQHFGHYIPHPLLIGYLRLYDNVSLPPMRDDITEEMGYNQRPERHYEDDFSHKYSRERKRHHDYSHKHDSKYMQPKNGYKRPRDRKYQERLNDDPFHMQPYNY